MDRDKTMTMARAFVLFWAGFWSFLVIGIFFLGRGKTVYGIIAMLALIAIAFLSWKDAKRGSLIFLAITVAFVAFDAMLLYLYPSGPAGFFFSALTVIFPLGAAIFFNKARSAKEAVPFDDGFGDNSN